MKKVIEKIEDVFTDITFAEAGDSEFLKKDAEPLRERFENIFVAIAMAEGGEEENSRSLSAKNKSKPFRYKRNCHKKGFHNFLHARHGSN